MQHFLTSKNLGLVAMRQATDDSEYNHVLITNYMVDNRYMYSGKGITIEMPLYLYTDNGEKVPNLDAKIVNEIEGAVGTTAPEDILDYVYGVLHSPSYRTKYSEFLKSDFPRVSYPTDKNTFNQLVKHGASLRALHLLTAPELAEGSITFPISGSNTVEKISFKENKVFINETQYFAGVDKAAFDFYIGGYQPAQKWLKDRKGSALTNADFEHYEKIITSLTKTIEIMKAIDPLMTGV